jgi:valyl-tRNA synthetase
MMAPYLPYITEEVWSWAYSEDSGMAESIHRSPWPSLEELEAVPEPEHEGSYDAAILVVEAVRKAKADANVSIKAPAQRVNVTASAETIAALKPTVTDIQAMLAIEALNLTQGEPQSPPLDVEVLL